MNNFTQMTNICELGLLSHFFHSHFFFFKTSCFSLLKVSIHGFSFVLFCNTQPLMHYSLSIGKMGRVELDGWSGETSLGVMKKKKKKSNELIIWGFTIESRFESLYKKGFDEVCVYVDVCCSYKDIYIYVHILYKLCAFLIVHMI